VAGIESTEGQCKSRRAGTFVFSIDESKVLEEIAH
jgi:hypothetical protein